MFDKRLLSIIIIIYVSVTTIVINLGVVRSDEKMEEEDQELAQIQQQQHQDAIKQHQEANSKALQIKLEQEHQDAIRQRQDAIDIEQQRQNAIRQQQEEAKATQIQREQQQHLDAIEQQECQEAIRQQQEEAKATQIQHEQQRQDAIEQQQRQEMQRAAAQLFQFGTSEWRGAGGGGGGGGFSVRRSLKANLEDRLSPKAKNLVKKSAKVKSTISDLVVEERKERKRALESKSRKIKGFAEGLRVDTEAQQLRAPSADLHAMEMNTIDEIGADLIREVQEVTYNFPSPTSLEDGVWKKLVLVSVIRRWSVYLLGKKYCVWYVVLAGTKKLVFMVLSALFFRCRHTLRNILTAYSNF